MHFKKTVQLQLLYDGSETKCLLYLMQLFFLVYMQNYLPLSEKFKFKHIFREAVLESHLVVCLVD